MPKVFKLDPEAAHFSRVDRYARQVEQLYLEAIQEAVSIGSTISLPEGSDQFTFDQYPQTKARIDKLMKTMSQKMTFIINEATGKEWYEAVANKASLIDSFIEKTQLTKSQLESYNSRNLEALQAFQNRKIGGLNLSEKVWKYTSQFKGDLEMALDIGIGDGRSAAELSRDVRSYLNDPEKLFRRVRDKHGVLQLSKNAKKYHPGAGQYRSSYKNAMRMTRTTINMAYRESDYLKNQQLDFVVGFKVVRSNHEFDCVVCNSLKGKYPKTFKFVGWHPHCRCHIEDILASEEEFINHQKGILAGKDVQLEAKNEVTELPKGFTKWVSDNEDRIEAAKQKGTLPYFLRDNEELITPKQREPYVYADSSFDKLRKLGVNVRTEQVSPYSYRVNMGEFDLDEFNDELLSLCNKNDISLNEVYLINDLGKMKYSVYGSYKGNLLKPFTMERSFKRSDGVISVSHDILVVPEELQGKGLSKQLFISLYKQYQKAEVETITVHANMDVGGYTWGKYGFMADKSYASKFYGMAKGGVFEGLMTDKEFSEISTYLNKCMNAKDDVDMHFIANRNYGKKFLLKSDWSGYINLSDKCRRDIFENYIFGK